MDERLIRRYWVKVPGYNKIKNHVTHLWDDYPLCFIFIANKQRGARRGTSKRARRTQRQPRVSRTNQIMDAAHRPPRLRLERNVFGFPKRLVTKLRYAAGEGLFMSSVTGSVAKYVFSCNSIFDPDRTSTGHQPLYHDTYQAIYDHYAVIESKITYRFVNNNASSYFNAGCVIEDDSGGSSVADTIIEQSTGRTTFLGPLASSHSFYTGTKTWNCMRDLNIDPYTSEQYKANFG